MLNILIVDDHAIVRRGILGILEDGLPEGVCLDEAANGQDAVRKVEQNCYDLMLLDISLPGRNGLEILKLVKTMSPGLPILILSMHPEEQYAIRALRAGAAGYLTKESAPEELMAAVDKVLRGGKYVSSSLSELLLSELGGSPGMGKPLHESLSDREYQIACMIASGKTVTDIAAELSLSVKTISTYRSRIMDKMNMKSNAEITSYAFREGLVN